MNKQKPCHTTRRRSEGQNSRSYKIKSLMRKQKSVFLNHFYRDGVENGQTHRIAATLHVHRAESPRGMVVRLPCFNSTDSGMDGSTGQFRTAAQGLSCQRLRCTGRQLADGSPWSSYVQEPSPQTSRARKA